MADLIPTGIEQRIRDAANIVDVLRDLGCELHRSGAEYECLNPFRDDRHIGSFKVSERRNIATDFASGETYNPIDAVMEGRKLCYPDALRYLAAMYGIYIDNEPKPVVAKHTPRTPAAPLPVRTWQASMLDGYTGHEDENPLLTWLLRVPMRDSYRQRLCRMLGEYRVGTSLRGWTQGWTIWPYINEAGQLTTAKFMKYRTDGHRDKEARVSQYWFHCFMEKMGRFDRDRERYEMCLFGLHLAPRYPKANICLVESEKTALICSAFSAPEDSLWLATGGKANLRPDMLRPLIAAKRHIFVHPDIDGYDEWSKTLRGIDYDRIYLSQQVRNLWQPADGNKADIADIMLRWTLDDTTDEGTKVATLLGQPEKAEVLNQLINRLNLQRI